MSITNETRLKDQLKTMALDSAELVGFAPVERMEAAPIGHRPRDLLKSAKTVIVIGQWYISELIENLPITRPVYTRYMITIREACDYLTYRMSIFLQKQGYKAFPIPNGDPYDLPKLMGLISLKHAAVAAGLGNFGLSNLVLSPQYGARLRFGAIITDVQLEPDPFCDQDICSQYLPICQRSCITKCPSKAIPDNERPDETILHGGVAINKLACNQYQDYTLGKFGRDGYSYRCGLCYSNCPAVRSIKTTDS